MSFLKPFYFFILLGISLSAQAQLIAEGAEAQKFFDEHYGQQKGDFLSYWGGAYDTTEEKMGEATRLRMEYYNDGFPDAVYGIINKKGDTLSAIFDWCQQWGENYVAVHWEYIEGDRVYQIYVVDNDFKAVEVYQSLPKQRTILMRKEGKWGTVHRGDFKIMSGFNYDLMENAIGWYETLDSAGNHDGYKPSIMAMNNGKWGMVSVKGETIIDFKYDALTFDVGNDAYNNGYLGKMDGSWQYFKNEGKVKLPESYDSIWVIENNQALVQQNGKWSYIYKEDWSSSEDYNPNWQQTAYSFDEIIYADKCLAVKQGGSAKWKFVEANAKAASAIDQEFDEIFVNESMWFVPVRQSGGKWGIFSTGKNEMNTDFIYDDVISIYGYHGVVVQDGREIEVHF